MRPGARRRGLVPPGMALLLLWASPAAGQGIEGRVGRFYEDGGWNVYRLGINRPLVGPLALGYTGSYLQRSGGEGAFAGLGADLSVFRGAGGGPYLVLGVAGGMGSPHSTSFSSFWGSWSGGVGYELFPASVLAVGAEARWREMSLDARDGVELSAGLSLRLGGARRREPAPDRPAEEVGPRPTREAPPGSAPSSAAAVREAVIASASEAMGRPYRYGGTGEDGSGFDCSGLIQYAYAEHGIPLPRTSAEQAKEGRKIERRLEALAPGDLLTFSNRGGPVTHVGLYLGDGRFIHSAARGVQTSRLSEEDPYGRWWFKRWVGARRIIGEE